MRQKDILQKGNERKDLADSAIKQHETSLI